MQTIGIDYQAMELRHVRYFLKAAQMGHFTRAARALHVSQPKLSLQIRQLEEEMGALLFERMGRRVQLTESGRLLLVHAQRALRELELGKQSIDELKGLVRGALHIAVTYAFSAQLLPRLLRQYGRRYPGISIEVTEGTTRDVEQGLLAGHFDLGFAYLSSERTGLVAEKLFEEELVVAVPAGHPWAQRAHVQLQDLHGVDVVLASRGFSTRQHIDAHLARLAIVPRVVLQSNDVDLLLEMVRLGAGVTLVSRHLLARREDIVPVSLNEPALARVAALLWREGAYHSAAARRFRALAMSRLQR